MAKKTKKYVVIGGQYAYKYYGSYPTLLGAKRAARQHLEYWDNWQGWHVPDIYLITDTAEADNGRYPMLDGYCRRLPITSGYLRGGKIIWEDIGRD